MNNTSSILLGDWISQSPNSFHATATMVKQLGDQGFRCLGEGDDWGSLNPGKYYVVRNESSIIAFCLTSGMLYEQGFAMIGAHTDSPCLKLKPNPCITKKGYYQLAVEVYGGALLNPWFDRDLSLAGRLAYLNGAGELKTGLINFEKPIAVIPSLAIHLDREANKKRSINPQTDILPILGLASKKSFETTCLDQLRNEGTTDVAELLDFELFFYDTQKPALVGLNQEFLASARLDNLVSCFIAAQCLMSVTANRPILLVCSDHEEVGSVSACGAQGSFLQSVLTRLVKNDSELAQCIHRSMLLSVDNAHGIHPNFAEKHDSQHGPLLNSGPVIKVNANQRYATNAQTSAYVRTIARDCSVPLQAFVVRSDMGCGSTIGPLTASEIGVKTVDIGIPTFAMHSIRELAGCRDIDYLHQLIKGFYQYKQAFV